MEREMLKNAKNENGNTEDFIIYCRFEYGIRFCVLLLRNIFERRKKL